MTVKAHVEHGYAIRTTEWYSGSEHLVLDEDLDSGRFHRKAGQPLCLTKVYLQDDRQWGSDPNGIDESHPVPTCRKCIELGARHDVLTVGFNYPITEVKRLGRYGGDLLVLHGEAGMTLFRHSKGQLFYSRHCSARTLGRGLQDNAWTATHSAFMETLLILTAEAAPHTTAVDIVKLAEATLGRAA
jgi:hypothetical protein